MIDKLQIAWNEAYSFSGRFPPNDAVYIGSVIKGRKEYLFYQDSQSQYWYESKDFKKRKKSCLDK